MREGEKNNYKAMAKTSKPTKTPERERPQKLARADYVQKEKANLVAKSQERPPTEQVVRIPRARIEKKPTETLEEFDRRKEFYSLSNKKVPKNAFKQHKIAKK